MQDMKERTKLKLFRIERKLSQEKFAEKIGFSRAHYALFENGKRDVTLRLLQGLKTAFGLSLEKAQELTKRDNE